jgi:voltage-gated potassium channel Kch
MSVKKFLEYGGLAAGIILVAFGIAAIVMGFQGKSTVQSSLRNEYIVGTPDMTPAAIKAEAVKAGLDLSKLDLPTKSVAGLTIDTGARARTFAQYMRIHTFEATGGLTYAQMGRWLDKNGKPTNDSKAAAIDPKTHQPIENGLRNLWVTETALTTALNVGYLASQIALFGIVVGFALLLSGIGFVILALAVLGNAFRRETVKATGTKFAPTPA